MQIRLINRILVRIEQTGKSAGYGETRLIVIPENHEKEFKFCGQVCAVGSRAITDVCVGDWVILDTYSQYIFENGSKMYAIVHPDLIAATLPEGKPGYLDIVPTGARLYASVA